MIEDATSDWLVIDDLNHCFGNRRVIDRLSLRMSGREPVLAIVGPSGIGKSTMLRILAGHLVPTSGRISVSGESVEGPSPARPMVFQDHNLFPWKSVLDNVTFGLKCAGVSRDERNRQGRELLAKLHMPTLALNLYPSQLSGGMQQRVGLARAIAVQPSCILMDEPFSALDGDMREALCEEISALAADQRTRFVIVTHDLADAAFLADVVLAFDKFGFAKPLRMNSPAHPRDRRLRFTKESLDRIVQLRSALDFMHHPKQGTHDVEHVT